MEKYTWEQLKKLVWVARGYQEYYRLTGNVKYNKKAMSLFKEIYEQATIKGVA